MKTKNKKIQTKTAVSLIILVITIIVMIILAGAIIITLSNLGVMDKASQAVDVTDMKQIETLASTLWADAYANGLRTKKELEKSVIDKLKDSIGKSKLDSYEITVTMSGVKVERKKLAIILDNELSEDNKNPTIATDTSYTLSGKITTQAKIKTFTVNGQIIAVANDGTWSANLTLVKDEVTKVTIVATDIIGNTTTKTGYVGYIVYTNFIITAANRSKVGYDNDVEMLELVIPATFFDSEDGKWKIVRQIATSAFENCINLKTVSIPGSCTGGIYTAAFRGCTNLTNVLIEEGVSGIATQAFKNCTNLVDVYMPDNISLVSEIFAYCTSLKNIQIPKNLTKIPSKLFLNCKSLEKVLIPDGVTIIDTQAFYKCNGLKQVEFGDESLLNSIGLQAFDECSSLTTINIPAGVTSIGQYVFRSCKSLTSVKFLNPNGWKAGTTEVGVTDEANAATLLKSTYAWCSWNRSDI